LKLSFLAGAAVGYVLGAKAGYERYEAIVRFSHKLWSSQTVQSSAGVLQAQFDDLAARARGVVSAKLTSSSGPGVNGFNGDRT
jgi:hypothetical protein